MTPPANLLPPSDPRLAARLARLMAALPSPLSPMEREFLEVVSWKLSKYHPSGAYRFFAAAWCLDFLGKLPDAPGLLTAADRSRLAAMRRLFSLDASGRWREFLAEVFSPSTDHGLFLFSAVFKYVLVTHERKWKRLLSDWRAYKRTIGHAHLVILNLLNLPKVEGILQDVYFKEFYPDQYAEMVRRTRTLSGAVRSHFFTINVVNEVSSMMQEAGAWGAVHVRFKSYFSIYNKIVRKGLERVLDVIGARVVFPDLASLARFRRLFESRIYVQETKDYVRRPKPNGYRSVHYKFFYDHLGVSSYVELQLRTLAMDRQIASQDGLSGLAYALRQKKYHPRFREIHEGLAEMARLLGAAGTPPAGD